MKEKQIIFSLDKQGWTWDYFFFLIPDARLKLSLLIACKKLKEELFPLKNRIPGANGTFFPDEWNFLHIIYPLSIIHS